MHADCIWRRILRHSYEWREADPQEIYVFGPIIRVIANVDDHALKMLGNVSVTLKGRTWHLTISEIMAKTCAELHSKGGSVRQCIFNHTSIPLKCQIRPCASPCVYIIAVTPKVFVWYFEIYVTITKNCIALLHSVKGSAGQFMFNHISIRLERQIQSFVSPYVCMVTVTPKGRIWHLNTSEMMAKNCAELHPKGGSVGQCIFNHSLIPLNCQIWPCASLCVCVIAVTPKVRVWYFEIYITITKSFCSAAFSGRISRSVYA